MTDPKVKAAQEKPPLAIIPPALLEQVSKVYAFGRDKYGPYSWRGGDIDIELYASAVMRHAVALVNGEWLDPESGLPHAAHIAATSGIILDDNERERAVQNAETNR